MLLKLGCCLESPWHKCRVGVWIVASVLAMMAVPDANCPGQDFPEQPGAAPAAGDPTTVMTFLAQSEVLDDLRLNQGQRDQIAKILTEQQSAEEQLQSRHAEQLQAVTSIGERLRKRAELRAQMRTEMEPKRHAAEQALRALLNAQQISALDGRLGATASASGTETTVSDDSEQATGSPVAPPRAESPVAAADAEASFAISGQASGTQAQADSAAGDGATGHGAAGDGATGDGATGDGATGDGATGDNPVSRVAFNFHHAPWPDVLRLFTDAAKLNLNLRDTPPGTFTYYDRQQYTPLEALDIMNRFLLQDGFLLLPHDRFLTVLDVNQGIPPNLVETVSPAELAEHGDTEYLRVVFALGDREAAAAAEEVRGLLGPQGEVVPLKSANSIVVADIGANLVRIQKLLEPPPKVEDSDRMFRSFPLQHIDAPSVADIVSSLFGLQSGLQNVSDAGGNAGRSSRSSGGSRDDRRAAMREFFSGGGGPGGRRGGGDDSGSSRGGTSGSATAEAAHNAAKVTVDLRTNTLLVTATAAEMKLIEEIVESVDIPPSQQSALSGLASNEPYLQVYELNTASASEVAKTLTVLHPGMVINEDGSAKRIHVWADAESHREISAHIRQLDGAIAGEVIAIIGLDGQNAYDMSAKLTSLYKNDATGAPAIELDPSGRGLMIRGNASQIGQIRSLVEQLDASGPYQSQQAVRLVPVSSSSTDFLQQAVGALYPQVTISPSAQAEGSSTASTARGGNRSRGSSSEDAERAARIQRFMEMRSRFGGFGRGPSDRGGGSGRGGRGDRGSSGGGRSSRGGR